jgi:deoxyribonuclease-4
MFRIGCHISSSGGYAAMGRRANALGGNTFAFFTRNPRGGAAKDIDPGDVAEFLAYCQAQDIDRLVAHAPYTLNPCAAKDNVRQFAFTAFQDDLQRMENTPGQYYNFHPGSHVGQGIDVGIEKIAEVLNAVLFPEMTTTVLLETMAGKGSEVGGRFQELRAIIDRVELSHKVGVCLDTCHIWDGGYDVVNDFDGVLTEFDKVIGLERLKAIHLNNSLNDIGSHKDRHAKIAEGKMPLEAIKRIICHPALEGKPFILETPNEEAGYAQEIALLKQLHG